MTALQPSDPLAAVRAALRPAGRILLRLWHEVMGALFALFAIVGAISFWMEWKKNSATATLLVPLAFFLMMGGFAVASFWRARRAAKPETGK
jgi:hypothetical protein